MASQVLGVAGAVVGSFFGMPEVGYMVGSSLGAALFPPPGQDGPRIGELAVQKSTYGAPIPIVYGAYRLSGSVIWATPLVEHAHEGDSGSGGGGGAGTTYTYTCSFAVLICAGVHGVSRIWADAKLIYDAGQDDPVSFKAGGYAIYTGTEDQLPDPTIEADKGVGSTPAYRGLTYFVFTDLELEKFGNRIPNLSFEVSTTVTETDATMLFDPIGDALNHRTGDPNGTKQYVMDYVPTTDTFWKVVDNYDGGYSTFPKGSCAIISRETLEVVGFTTGESDFALWDVAVGWPAPPGDVLAALNYYQDYKHDAFLVGTSAGGAWAGKENHIAIPYNGGWTFIAPYAGMQAYDADNADMWVYAGGWSINSAKWPFNNIMYSVIYNPVTDKVWGFSDHMIRIFNATTGAVEYETPTSYASHELTDYGAQVKINPYTGEGYACVNFHLMVYDATDGHVTAEILMPDHVFSVCAVAARKVCYTTDHAYYSNVEELDLDTGSVITLYEGAGGSQARWVNFDPTRRNLMISLHAIAGDELVLQAIVMNVDTGGIIESSLIPYAPYFAELEYDAAHDLFWTTTSDYRFMAIDPVTLQTRHLPKGDMAMEPLGARQNVRAGPAVLNCVYSNVYDTAGIARYCWGGNTIGDRPTVGEIVSDITSMTPLALSKVDTRQLTDRAEGYCITGNMSARSAIEPLMQAYFFDSVESDSKVKFVKRGSPSVVSIPVDNLIEKS